MDQFVDHFINLISNDNVDNGLDTTNTMECVFEELDKPFTENEIETCIKGLNRNKSPGVDNILDEYILEGKTILIPILCKLFNVILCTSRFPRIMGEKCYFTVI